MITVPILPSSEFRFSNAGGLDVPCSLYWHSSNNSKLIEKIVKALLKLNVIGYDIDSGDDNEWKGGMIRVMVEDPDDFSQGWGHVPPDAWEAYLRKLND